PGPPHLPLHPHRRRRIGRYYPRADRRRQPRLRHRRAGRGGVLRDTRFHRPGTQRGPRSHQPDRNRRPPRPQGATRRLVVAGGQSRCRLVRFRGVLRARSGHRAGHRHLRPGQDLHRLRHVGHRPGLCRCHGRSAAVAGRPPQRPPPTRKAHHMTHTATKPDGAVVPHIHPACRIMHVTFLMCMLNSLALQLGAWPVATVSVFVVATFLGLLFSGLSQRRRRARTETVLRVNVPTDGGDLTLTGPHTPPRPVAFRRRTGWWLTGLGMDVVAVLAGGGYLAATLTVVMFYPHLREDEYLWTWESLIPSAIFCLIGFGLYKLWKAAHVRATARAILDEIDTMTEQIGKLDVAIKTEIQHINQTLDAAQRAIEANRRDDTPKGE